MKVLTIIPTMPTITICNTAYKHHIEGMGETYHTHQACQTICILCYVAM